MPLRWLILFFESSRAFIFKFERVRIGHVTVTYQRVNVTSSRIVTFPSKHLPVSKMCAVHCAVNRSTIRGYDCNIVLYRTNCQSLCRAPKIHLSIRVNFMTSESSSHHSICQRICLFITPPLVMMHDFSHSHDSTHMIVHDALPKSKRSGRGNSLRVRTRSHRLRRPAPESVAFVPIAVERFVHGTYQSSTPNP